MRLNALRRMVASLRLRLTLTYVALLGVLLAGLGIFQYLSLQRDLVDTRVQALDGDVGDGLAVWREQVAAAAHGFPPGTARSPEVARADRVRVTLCANIPNGTTSGVGNPVTVPAVRAAVARIEADALACAISRTSGQSVAVIVYARNLNPVTSAGKPLAQIPRIESGALVRALGGRRSPAEVVDTPSGPQLTVAFPLDAARASAAVDGVAQLSTPTAPIDAVLSGERQQLALGGAATLLVAFLAGLLLTSRALRPLRRLTETSRLLAGGDLRARSGLSPRDDEVGTLAHSFDDMAARIEESFAAQAESEARMRRFIADASHELRTPITALKGYIDVLQRGVSREPEALDAALAAMARESERMRVLVLDLLALARLDAARPPVLVALDLNEVISGVVDDGVPGMPDQLDRALTPQPLIVLADRGSVITIARNLLINACKYAPRARQEWSTAVDGGRARFTVRDDGPGISAADLPHVFERFYRGEKTRAREEGGSGLGLSIVQGLARALGGDAAVQSTEGAGTAVSVWLPLAPGEAAPGEPHERQAEATTSRT